MMWQRCLAVLITAITSITATAQLIYAALGGSASLGSQLSLSWQNKQVWTKDDELFAKVSIHGTKLFSVHRRRISISWNRLLIKDIKEVDFGIYRLTTMYYLSNKSPVNETFVLSNYSVSSPSTLLPGEILNLDCSTNPPVGYKVPEIHWVKPCGTIMKKDGGKLTVRVTTAEQGQWACVLTTDQMTYTATITVKILSLTAPDYQYTSESSPLTLPCSITPQVSWAEIKSKGFLGVYWHFLPGSRVIPEGPQRLFSLLREDMLTWKEDQGRGLSPAAQLKHAFVSLSRKLGRDDDEGEYQCSMVFRNVTLTTTIHVETLHISSGPDKTLFIGQLLNLSCSTSRPLPSDLRLKWIPPFSSSLPPQPRDHFPMFVVIPEATSGDSGRWMCELWHENTYLTSAVTHVTIEPRKSQWKLVTISTTTVTVFLLVLICLVYRRRQKKRRPRRRQYCRCKHPKIRRVGTQQAPGS